MGMLCVVTCLPRIRCGMMECLLGIFNNCPSVIDQEPQMYSSFLSDGTHCIAIFMRTSLAATIVKSLVLVGLSKMIS